MNKITFKFRALFHKAVILLLVAKTHDSFNTCAVVPRTVKKNHFPTSRKMFNVALKIPLTQFPFIRLFQSHNASATRIHVLHEALNSAAFARRIPAFKKNNEQFHLKGKLFLLVCFTIEAIFVRIDASAPILNQNIIGIIHSRTGCRVI